MNWIVTMFLGDKSLKNRTFICVGVCVCTSQKTTFRSEFSVAAGFTTTFLLPEIMTLRMNYIWRNAYVNNFGSVPQLAHISKILFILFSECHMTSYLSFSFMLLSPSAFLGESPSCSWLSQKSSICIRTFTSLLPASAHSPIAFCRSFHTLDKRFPPHFSASACGFEPRS